MLRRSGRRESAAAPDAENFVAARGNEASDVPVFTQTPDLMRLPPIAGNEPSPVPTITHPSRFVRSDYAEFYSRPGLARLAVGIGVGAAMANSSFDEYILHDAYSENILLAPTHEFHERFHQPKVLGDGWYTIPAFAVTALSEPILGDLPIASKPAEWGQRSLRTILVGGPPLLALQYLTGASRPGESAAESNWKPFDDNNGVSGHSFMGAIPFLSAANMTDNSWLKAGLYTASMLPALSRVNDDDHYPSQVFLGWWLAYTASSAVDRSQSLTSREHIHVFPQPGGVGVQIKY